MKNIKSQHFSDNKLWKPRYGAYSRRRMLERLDMIQRSGVAPDQDIVQSRSFINKVFDQYDGTQPSKKYGFVFAVPTRITRGSAQYATEATHFLPVINYLDQDIRQKFITGLPPSVIDEYVDSSGQTNGAVLFVPLFTDMLTDIPNRIQLKLTVMKIIKDTARFAHEKLGAEIVGLGATLPKITRYGRDIRNKDLLTTTGHGGTVYIIYKMYYAIRSSQGSSDTQVTGIIGCGAIGEATARLLLEDDEDLSIIMHDIRAEYQAKIVASLIEMYGDRVVGVKSNLEVLNRASVIISAVTSPIHVEESVDLRNKVIIDDSQPGSFMRPEVEAAGGRLVWVVAHDNSSYRLLHRTSGYRFGDEGLMDAHDVWGCEAEVAALWAMNRSDLSLSDSVSPDSVRAIGATMDKAGITIASWQCKGQPTTISGKE